MKSSWSPTKTLTNGLVSVPTLVLLVAARYFYLSQALPLSKDNNDYKQSHFPAIFNFGDSNSDTGGISALYGSVVSPNGETFFGAPAGRFCDGRLIIDFLTEHLGLPFLHSYLDSIGSNFSHGANFATEGSTVRPQNTTRSQKGYSPISLDVQFAEFSNFIKRSRLFREQGGVFEGLLPKDDYFARALYTFDIGQNDITASYKLYMSTEQAEILFTDVVAQLAKILKGVYAQGGRTFWIHNTGPVGCLAYLLNHFTNTTIDEIGCLTKFNEAAQLYNTKLKEVVVQLRMELPQAAITLVDVYSLKYTLFTQASKLGFEDPLVACCGYGGKYNFNNAMRCGSMEIQDGKEILVAKSCENPTVKVVWDGIHYTQTANKWIWDMILDNVSYLDPPLPLRRACDKLDHSL